jgi:adenine nucleotide transporter 17
MQTVINHPPRLAQALPARCALFLAAITSMRSAPPLPSTLALDGPRPRPSSRSHSYARSHPSGSITTLVTNPIWTVQTAQSTNAVTVPSSSSASPGGTKKVKLSATAAARDIINKDGLAGLWRGLGPALVLVINPVIQYTTFERLVGVLLSYRLARAGAGVVGATPTAAMAAAGKQAALGRSSLSDWDMFVLGAASKLVATGGTYPYVSG